MSGKMPLVSKADAEKFFNQVDTSGDGQISIQELKAVMESNSNFSNADIARMFNEIDDDGDKKITLEEFVNDVCLPSRDQALEEAFSNFDSDNSGTLTRDEFRSALKGHMSDMSELDGILDKIDRDGSGNISKDEFMSWMNSNF